VHILDNLRAAVVVHMCRNELNPRHGVEHAVTQLTIYALALSRRTGLPVKPSSARGLMNRTTTSFFPCRRSIPCVRAPSRHKKAGRSPERQLFWSACFQAMCR